MLPSIAARAPLGHDHVSSPARFIVLMAAWTTTLLAAARLPWIERGAIETLVSFQRTLAEWYGASMTSSVVVNASCSGDDQIALCLGVTLAYPVAWPRRLVGAAGGLLVVLVLNTIRIGTLLTTADMPQLFNTLHLYVWPAVLMAAVLVYVLIWIRWTERRAPRESSTLLRFGALASLLLLAYAGLTPWMFSSALVERAGVWTAQAGQALLSFTGTVSARGSVLITQRGTFQVTQECLLTPLLPLYLAAAVTLPLQWQGRIVGLLAAVPVFLALGVLRLLVLATPPYLLDTPIVAVHGFFQLVLGAMIIGIAAAYRSNATGGRSTMRRVAVSLAWALMSAVLVAPWWNVVLAWSASTLQGLAPHVVTDLRPPEDVQGAIVLLPVYQVSLLTGLWLALGSDRGATRYLGASALLFAGQVLTLVIFGEFEAHTGVQIHALAIRIVAVGAPVLLTLTWMAGFDRPAPATASYRDFWHDVGAHFPSLTGAASTGYYFDNEVRLLQEQLPGLSGSRLLKTDLWDEAKNTRILQWAAGQGARVFGIDISGPIAVEARQAFDGRPLRASQADVRAVPFADASFDAIYSMGTIEHFPESEQAVHEFARVLKPGGRLILGVPNLHDPFLRPLLVWLLQRTGLYGYGDERAFSRRALRAMLERAGLEVVAESGILFMPGWLRMLDLWCHTRAKPLTRVTAPLVGFFATLDRHVPGLRRHGYLLASVGRKPTAARPGAPPNSCRA